MDLILWHNYCAYDPTLFIMKLKDLLIAVKDLDDNADIEILYLGNSVEDVTPATSVAVRHFSDGVPSVILIHE